MGSLFYCVLPFLRGAGVVALLGRTWRSPGRGGVSVFVLVLGEGTSEFIYSAAVNGRLHYAPRCLPCLPTLLCTHDALLIIVTSFISTT